ncbi:MAG TPA: hypothetical protein VGJ47_05615 [Gemmatimonadaceae bacterium]|jgi:hypothetical protein
MALYAFGGGGSGAANRLTGLLGSRKETASLAIGSTVGDWLPAIAIGAHEVMAAQHGMVDDLHGAGCSFLFAGNS